MKTYSVKEYISITFFAVVSISVICVIISSGLFDKVQSNTKPILNIYAVSKNQ
jgi:hypothetical protein